MALVPGIRNSARMTADQAVAASTTLVSATDLPFSLAAGQRMHARYWMPFTLGVTGGFKFQITPSATAANYLASLFIYDMTTPGVQTVFYGTVLTSVASFANAAAVAGNYLLIAECTLRGNASAASTINFQFACNSAANAITMLAGGFVDFVSL
jgi:hypothetical protein